VSEGVEIGLVVGIVVAAGAVGTLMLYRRLTRCTHLFIRPVLVDGAWFMGCVGCEKVNVPGVGWRSAAEAGALEALTSPTRGET